MAKKMKEEFKIVKDSLHEVDGIASVKITPVEFNLSECSFHLDDILNEKKEIATLFGLEDVKEFIRLLKDKHWIDIGGEKIIFIPISKFDKLAGEKLV